MMWILGIGIDTLAAAVVLVPTMLLLWKFWYHSGKKTAVYTVLAIYLAAVYVAVGLPNVTYFRFDLNCNFVPVLGMAADFKNSVLNVLLFVPLGLLLPMLCPQFRKVSKTLLFGFWMSFFVEFFQMFTLRATDVNDLITNVMGTLLGYGIACLLLKRFPKMRRNDKAGEIYGVLSIVLLVMFFVWPFLSSAFWAILLK